MGTPAGRAPRPPAEGRWLAVEEAAELLGCSIDEVGRWRRWVLPTGPRRRAAQPDDAYRADEIIAVAVGRWLEALRRREAPVLAARLVGDLPAEGTWCVLVTYRTVRLITDPSDPELAERRKVREAVFHPDGYVAALRERGAWPGGGPAVGV